METLSTKNWEWFNQKIQDNLKLHSRRFSGFHKTKTDEYIVLEEFLNNIHFAKKSKLFKILDLMINKLYIIYHLQIDFEREKYFSILLQEEAENFNKYIIYYRYNQLLLKHNLLKSLFIKKYGLKNYEQIINNMESLTINELISQSKELEQIICGKLHVGEKFIEFLLNNKKQELLKNIDFILDDSNKSHLLDNYCLLKIQSFDSRYSTSLFNLKNMILSCNNLRRHLKLYKLIYKNKYGFKFLINGDFESFILQYLQYINNVDSYDCNGKSIEHISYEEKNKFKIKNINIKKNNIINKINMLFMLITTILFFVFSLFNSSFKLDLLLDFFIFSVFTYFILIVFFPSHIYEIDYDKNIKKIDAIYDLRNVIFKNKKYLQILK